MPNQKKILQTFIKNFTFILTLFAILISCSCSVNDVVSTNDQKKLSDIEIVTFPGQPKFYGNFNDAKNFWQGYNKVKVVGSRGSFFDEDALLLITSQPKSNVITSVSLNFSYSNEIKHNLTVDDVLQFLCHYIPFDILERYYTFNNSFHEINFDGTYEAYHYVMKLNDEGFAASKKSGINYENTFAFKIIHRNDDDWIATIDSLSADGNHKRFSGYTVEDWNIDLNNHNVE